MELSASLRKTIKSLGAAKNRREENLFVAEGTKAVLETIDAFRLRYLIATPQWLNSNKNIAETFEAETIAVKAGDIERMTQLQTPRDVIAVYEIPDSSEIPSNIDKQLVIALDRIQDPGNLGTIIRLADWFGVKHIIASSDTADCFNPKVVQATMGAIGRVNVHYVENLATTLKKLSKKMPVYGTFLDGTDIYSTPLSPNGIVVMGNEGNGISTEVSKCVGRRLLIPSFPPERTTVESLNVSMATSIVVAEFRRRVIVKR